MIPELGRGFIAFDLDELDPVSERVIDEAAAPAGKLLRLGGFAAEIPGGLQNPIEGIDDQRRMGLAGGAEVLFGAHVKLHPAVSEPGAAQFQQAVRFRHLAQAEHRRIEGAGSLDAA
jgi:hypothetical protein